MSAIAQIKTSMLITHPDMFIDIFQDSENENQYIIEYNAQELAAKYPFDSTATMAHIYLMNLRSEKPQAVLSFRSTVKTISERFSEASRLEITS